MAPSESRFLKKGTDGKYHCIIIGAPMADGQPIKGVEKGPDALRDAGLKDMIQLCDFSIEDWGNLNLADGEEQQTGNTQDAVNILNASHVGKACETIFDATRKSADEGNFTLVLGGDHGLAGGSIAGILSVYSDLAVIWVDAHGDCNTPETSPSGNYHGMPAAQLMGWFGKQADVLDSFKWTSKYPKLAEDRLSLIGLRDVDASEGRMLRGSKVNCYTMKRIDRDGIAKVVEEAIRRVDPEGKRPIHLSFDIDACDPAIAPGTGTLAPGGLSYREAHYIAETIYETGRLVSMDLVEVNPSLEKTSDERVNLHGDRIKLNGDRPVSRTARLAVDLIGSAFGTVTM